MYFADNWRNQMQLYLLRANIRCSGFVNNKTRSTLHQKCYLIKFKYNFPCSRDSRLWVEDSSDCAATPAFVYPHSRVRKLRYMTIPNRTCVYRLELHIHTKFLFISYYAFLTCVPFCASKSVYNITTRNKRPTGGLHIYGQHNHSV